MLYDFHRQENAKRAGSVHATYLVTGSQVKNAAVETNGYARIDVEDLPMQSSPYASSPVPKVEEDMPEESTKLLTLAREEHLESM